MIARPAAKILLLAILLLPACATAAGLGELRLSLIEGDVQIKSADTEDWAPATINFPLKDGDQLWVPDEGRAEVEARRGTVLRLDERSALDILTVDNDAMQFYLSMGLVYVNAKGERDTTLQLDTPLSSIRVYERAKFSAEVANDGETDIAVYLGAVSAESKKGQTTVTAGYALSLAREAADLSPLAAADAWERWNKEQDRTIEEHRASVRYLPEELAGYARDFDANGEWVDMPTYGHVWRPLVQVTVVDWSPYRHGRWVWVGGDYVWIAQERWGWAPYHYGRWSHIPRHGWCWVPPARHEVYWGPGYVGWVRTPTYVAWVPLAPREVYYGHGYYGPHSVNIVHVDVNKVVINNVYQNVYVKNSVTTVHHETFLRGRQVDFKVDGNPFLKEKINVGRPQITPERTTKIAAIREIPKAKEPPALVKESKIEELKEQRRLVKKRDKSVFLPEGGTPPAMPVEEKKEPRPKTLRKTKLTAEEPQQAVPPKTEEAKPVPAEREIPAPGPATPPTGRREDKQGPPPEVKDRRAIGEEGRSLTGRPLPPPPAPREEARPTPVEKGAPPPAPKSGREGRQEPAPEADDRRPSHDKGRPPASRPLPPTPAPREAAPPTPTEEEALPPELSPPPPKSRREDRPEPPPEATGRRPSRDADRPPASRLLTPAPAPREAAPPTPAEEEGLPPEELPPPPPKSRRGGKQRPPPETEDKQPAPDEVKEGGKEEGARSRRDRREKVQKEPPAEAEAAPAEKSKE